MKKRRYSTAEISDLSKRMKWDKKSEEESIKIGESIWAQDMQKIRKSNIIEEAANNAILKSKPTLK